MTDKMKKKSFRTVVTQVLIVSLIIVVVNILSDRFYFRLDFTADKRYTLSEATTDILESLSEPVTITAYFTEDVPSQLAKVRRDFKEMLIEFSDVSDGNVVYEFIDPNVDPQLEQEAAQQGIMPRIVNVRERDQMTQKRVFLGASLQMGEDKEIIPVIQPGSAMEYDLASTIKKLSIVDKPVIGLVQGHGEPPQAALQQGMASLDILYEVEDVFLDDSALSLSKYATLAIVAPADTIPPAHLQILDQFLASGGKLYIGLNRVRGDFSSVQGVSVYTGLEDWLSGKGLSIENGFVVDALCGTVGVQQQSGFMNFTTQISFPYLPRIKDFADHPITKGLEEIMLQFASPINFTGDTNLVFTPIAKSSDKSGTQSAPVFFDINKKWQENDFPLSQLTVGAVLEGPINGNPNSKIVLFSDGDFAVNGQGQRPQQLAPDNVSLFVNSIDWLSDETGLIDLRTKSVTSRPLDPLEDDTKTMIKWINFLLPIIFIILYGIIRAQIRKRTKVKRMEEGYV
jgi:gliding-associated putative ABC transporter substrate-binding component GldG